MDLQGSPSKKRGRGSKRGYKKQLAETKNDCMAFNCYGNFLQSVLSFLEEKEEVSKMPWGWIAG